MSSSEAASAPGVACRGLRKVYGTTAPAVALDRFVGDVL